MEQTEAPDVARAWYRPCIQGEKFAGHGEVNLHKTLYCIGALIFTLSTSTLTSSWPTNSTSLKTIFVNF